MYVVARLLLIGVFAAFGGTCAIASAQADDPTSILETGHRFGGSLRLQSPDPSPPRYAASSSLVSGLQPESRPYEVLEDETDVLARPNFGPAPVAESDLLAEILGLNSTLSDCGLRLFGWVEAGYSGASSASGLLSVQPRQNQFGNEFLLSQLALTLQKPLTQDEFNTGFNVRYLAGADGAFIAAKGGIGDPPDDLRFGQDLADLYVSAHLPVLTEGGMDMQLGRMQTIIGYNAALAPYRPFYSSDYQFFYSQDGGFTGLLTNLHVSEQMDVWNGVTLGANTFFTKRSQDSICYIGQINYWLTTEKRTRLTGSVYAGPDALLAAPDMEGDFVTMVELRMQHQWCDTFTQVIQSNMGWDANTPVGTGSWYGVYTIGILNLTEPLDALVRLDWFDDVQGTRTGIATNYEAVTLGINWHPWDGIEFRPEIRGDFAGATAFGREEHPRDRAQLTAESAFSPNSEESEVTSDDIVHALRVQSTRRDCNALPVRDVNAFKASYSPASVTPRGLISSAAGSRLLRVQCDLRSRPHPQFAGVSPAIPTMPMFFPGCSVTITTSCVAPPLRIPMCLAISLNCWSTPALRPNCEGWHLRRKQASHAATWSIWQRSDPLVANWR